MKKYILSLLVFFGTFSLMAQSYQTLNSVSEKVRKQYTMAYNYISMNEIGKGIAELHKIIKKNPDFINPYILLGDTYREEKELDSAAHYFQKALQVAPRHEPKIHYALGQIYLNKKAYDLAAQHLELFLTEGKPSPDFKRKVEKELGDAAFRADYAKNPNPIEAQLINISSNINTPLREYFPSITIASDMLVYTVERPSSQGRGMQEDLYYSVYKNGEWSIGQPIPNVNTPDNNEGAQKISADGKFLVFTVCNRPGDYGSCDLYYSINHKGQWSTPKNIGAPINSSNWESQPSVAPNGEAIYFARGVKGGTTGIDLYVSYKQADGKWGKAEALTEINTPFDDISPCIHPDGQTLYFVSNGYPGFGGFDIYVSRKGEDGKFSKPINLGWGINSEKDEQDISVSLKGDLAYLSSHREGGQGLVDIYTVALPDAVKPLAVTYVELIVKDAKTKKVIQQAEVNILNISTEKTFLMTSTDKAGELLVCLPMGKDYAAQIKKEGYLFHSEQFALNANYASDKPLKLEIFLQPISETLLVNSNNNQQAPKAIILKNIFFDTNSAKLKNSSQQELQQLKVLLIEQPNMRIQINGHTDSEGDDTSNLVLSQNRAQAVKDYLIKEGIEAGRLEAKGFGESMPIDSNDTAQGRSNNRRTEFVILSNK